MEKKTTESFLTCNQAAMLLNVSLSTVKKMIYAKNIRTFKTPGGHHRILKSDLLNSCHYREAWRSCAGKAADGEDAVAQTLAVFVTLLERRRVFCRGHSLAVAAMSQRVAAVLQLPELTRRILYQAALLHDLGMAAVPSRILNSAAVRSSAGQAALRQHPLRGAELLCDIAVFNDVRPVIEQHHERPDGSGYPRGLSAGVIRIEAKIIAVAEAFDCMTAADSYKNPLPRKTAVRRIAAAAGTQFDTAVAEAFVKNAEHIVGPDRARTEVALP